MDFSKSNVTCGGGSEKGPEKCQILFEWPVKALVLNDWENQRKKDEQFLSDLLNRDEPANGLIDDQLNEHFSASSTFCLNCKLLRY